MVNIVVLLPTRNSSQGRVKRRLGERRGQSEHSGEHYFLFGRQSNELSFIHPVVLSLSWAILDPLKPDVYLYLTKHAYKLATEGNSSFQCVLRRWFWILPRAAFNFKRWIKSRLPFSGIIRSSLYSPRFQDKG